MGAKRKTQTFIVNAKEPLLNPKSGHASSRNLQKKNLGGVIFGCTNKTIQECLTKQLFGLPASHFLYVQKINPGLPLFLFNYSKRQLLGIFEAASPGKMNINPYGWTADGSERTLYPAQVQVRVRLQCQPLLEDQFRPIIADNYYMHNHFWFELDHAQASKLMSSLASVAVAPGCFLPGNMRSQVFRPFPSNEGKENSEKSKRHLNWASDSSDADPSVGEDKEEEELFKQLDSEIGHINDSDWEEISTDDVSLNHNQQWKVHLDEKGVEQEEKDLIVEELASENEHRDLYLTDHVGEPAGVKDMNLKDENPSGERVDFTEKNEYSCTSSHSQAIIARLIQEVEELKTFKTEHMEKMNNLELKLVQAENEIQWLKDNCKMVETMTCPSTLQIDETVIEPLAELHLDPTESVYLVGGYDGESCLSTLDSYFPSCDIVKSFKPMNSVRSYASVARLNGELYVFGGGDGHVWYDTVELYKPVDDEWTSGPPLNGKKGSLAGAAMNDKIFAIGGGNGVGCFSDVEMLDLHLGRWIRARSMLQKRFALAAVEHNGVLYATGGYDGSDYLNSVERFDLREHSWTRIACMNTRRGCHSLAVLNDKLYALGGFNGHEMVPSVEIYDPRLGTWMSGEPMKQPRGYSAVAVIKDYIYVIGGVRQGDEVVDTVVARWKEGEGWEETVSSVIGRRCFMAAITY